MAARKPPISDAARAAIRSTAWLEALAVRVGRAATQCLHCRWISHDPKELEVIAKELQALESELLAEIENASNDKLSDCGRKP